MKILICTNCKETVDRVTTHFLLGQLLCDSCLSNPSLLDTCERCGEEVGSKMIGDEIYRNCPNCGMGIEQ